MAGPLDPAMGEREFNGAEFTYLVDLKPTDLIGLRTALAGLAEVLGEIAGNETEWGEKAGMTPGDAAALVLLNERIDRIDTFLAPVMKFAEMLSETRYLLEDRRQRLILNLGASVERRGKEIPELLAKYEKTRAYRSAVGKKAAKTRRRNAEEAAAGGEVPEQGTEPDKTLVAEPAPVAG